MADKIRVLLNEEEVDRRIKEIAEQINKDYEGKAVHLICILKGGVFFTCELAQRLTVPVTLVSVFLGAISGIVISRRNDKMSHGIYYYFIFGLTLTLQTASIFFLLQALHIYGTFFSVICIFISLRIPFTVMTFCSFVKGVPREIDEAAIMDGCNFWQMTLKILMPILKPIMVTNVVITAIDVWNNFMIPLFYLGSAKKATVSMAIYSFFGRYNRDWQYVFAALMLVVFPMLLLFIILQKHIIAGMTAGAVKG